MSPKNKNQSKTQFPWMGDALQFLEKEYATARLTPSAKPAAPSPNHVGDAAAAAGTAEEGKAASGKGNEAGQSHHKGTQHAAGSTPSPNPTSTTTPARRAAAAAKENDDDDDEAT